MKRICPLLLVSLLALAAPAAGQDPPHDPGNGLDCLSCHVMHNAPGAHYTTIPGVLNLCLSCHNPLGVAPVETHSPGGVDIGCTVCHDPHTQEQAAVHGSSYSKLVHTTIATPNSGDRLVKLMAPTGPHSFADGDAVYDGVCEVCHTVTDYHRNNPSGNHAHNVATNCTGCHPHEAGFRPTGGECTACHDEPQPGAGYRRQVVENNGDGNGDFVKPYHHVNDGSGQESVTPADCAQCHDQSFHQSWPEPQVFLLDPDGGPAVVYTGAPGGMATDFCAHCHDADGRGGDLQPFSSGNTPADVARWWMLPAKHDVAALGAKCLDCHANGHGGDNPQMLVELEEVQCLDCHAASFGIADIAGEFAKAYVHPIAAQSLVHELGEDPLAMPRHVECVDCHNPHAANLDLTAAAPATPGGMLGVGGIDGDGNVVAEAANGFEVCYKCHAATNPGAPAFPRQDSESDVAVEFDPLRASFHPIEAHGKYPNPPSLIGGWTEASIMRCEDCHAGDGGIAGPHGSSRRWILKARYDTADPAPESAAAYALCYGCHSRTSILGNQSFELHRYHVLGENASCSVCHDGHGSGQTHLINFRTDVVTPNYMGVLNWIDLGDKHGRCNLRCHGEWHVNESY